MTPIVCTGLRVSELANLIPDRILWQEKRIMVYGKGGPYGKKTKRRIVPLTDRTKKLLEIQFASQNEIGLSTRTIQRIITRLANKAMITKKVTPRVLRHTFAVRCIQDEKVILPIAQFLGVRRD